MFGQGSAEGELRNQPVHAGGLERRKSGLVKLNFKHSLSGTLWQRKHRNGCGVMLVMLEPVFLYCERSASGVWAEPVNLAACMVLLVVAWAVWRKAGDLSSGGADGDTWAATFPRRLAMGIAVLGLAAILLHSVPSRLTVGFILVVIVALMLMYFHAVNRWIVGLSPVVALVCTLLVLPFAAVSLPLVAVDKGASSSFAFVAIPVLLLGYAVLLRPEHPATARGFSVGAAITLAGIAARSLDAPLCDRFPVGTHFLWILAVSWLLWHLSRVYSAHMLAARAAGR